MTDKISLTPLKPRSSPQPESTPKWQQVAQQQAAREAARATGGTGTKSMTSVTNGNGTVGTALTGGTALAKFDGKSGAKDGAKEELKSLNLLKVYKRIFPANITRNASGSETKVQCFNSAGHSNGDRNPSMSINEATGVFKCFACDTGGDIIDMFATIGGYAHDMKCPNDRVHQAVYDAATKLNLGWEFHQAQDGNWYRGAAKNTAPTASADPTAGMATVTQLNPAGTGHITIVPPKVEELPELNWRELIDSNTPLREYLETVCQDDLPEEYHFWNFLILMGLLLGRDVAFADSTPVYANIFACLVGTTGMGKSRSMAYIKDLMGRDELAFDSKDPYSDGVKMIRQPGSGEVLAHNFIHKTPDPNWIKGMQPTGTGAPVSHKQPDIEWPVRGLIQFEELAALVGKSDGKGSMLKATVMDLYDSGRSIGGSSFAHGSYEAKLPFGSIITSTQPAIISQMFTGADAESGFLNRWIFIPGTKKTKHPIGKFIDLDPVIPYCQQVKDWAADIKTNSGGLLEFADQAALTEFERVCNDTVFEKEEINGLQRIHLLFKKLIILCCANSGDGDITLESTLLAEKLLLWIIDTVSFQAIDRLGDLESSLVEEYITSTVVECGVSGITPGELRKRAKRKFKSMRNIDKIYLDSLRQIQNDGAIMEIIVPPVGGARTRGRPSKRIILDKYVPDYFPETNS